MTPISKNIKNKLVIFYLFNKIKITNIDDYAKDFLYTEYSKNIQIKHLNLINKYNTTTLNFLLSKLISKRNITIDTLLGSNIHVSEYFILMYISKCSEDEITYTYKKLYSFKYNVTDRIRKSMIKKDKDIIYEFVYLEREVSLELIDLALKRNPLLAKIMFNNLLKIPNVLKAKILNDNIDIINNYRKNNYDEKFTEVEHKQLKKSVNHFIQTYG
jgi:hypothetical protein